MEEEEIWRNATEWGFSKYLFSNLGNVKNVRLNRILECSDKNDHFVYQLINDEKQKKHVKSDFIIGLFKPNNLIEEKDNYTWTPIPGFEKYKICPEGKILSTKNKIMKPYLSDGSLYIKLISDENKHKHYRIQILVASIFIENPNNFKFVKFKDKNVLNVNKNNLEWANNTSKNEDLPGEIWEPVIGFPKYEINPKGIRSAKTHEILSSQLSSYGYPSVSLYIDTNIKRKIRLHIAMAKQYIPNPNNFPVVNHKNGIKTDYRIENLEWTTQSLNMIHAVETGLLKMNNKGRKTELLDEYYNIIKIFSNHREAADHIGCDSRKICYYMKNYLLDDDTIIINGFRLRHEKYVDLEGEIWKNVNTLYNNINDRYKVSNYGRVKNDRNLIMEITTNIGGYGQIGLSNYSKDKNYQNNKKHHNKILSIHSLVAFAFLEFKGNRIEYQVNHIDKNPRNNNIDNLEILKIKDHNIKDHGKPVLCVKNDIYYIFRSQTEAADSLNFKLPTINAAILNHNYHGGYYWYDLGSEKAQDIINEFQSEGINQSIFIQSKVEEPVRKPRFKIITDPNYKSNL